jgi:hypothetical protein
VRSIAFGSVDAILPVAKGFDMKRRLIAHMKATYMYLNKTFL